LAPRIYARVGPTPVANPQLVVFNRCLAEELGLDPDLIEREAAAMLSGNQLPDDSNPIAMAYAGHQFGNFVPQLGDGRAILLGELKGRDGVLRDLQLKGAGLTPFSRDGDGRAALGPMLREYLISEAMHALGIPTTRALAVVTTGEQVFREEVLPVRYSPAWPQAMYALGHSSTLPPGATRTPCVSCWTMSSHDTTPKHVTPTCPHW